MVGEAEVVEVVEAEVEAEEVAVGGGDEGVAEKGGGRRQGGWEGQDRRNEGLEQS